MPEDLNLTAANEGALADIVAANATPAPEAQEPAPAAAESAPPADPAAPAAAAPEAEAQPAAAPEAAPAPSTPAEPVDKAPQQEWVFTRKGQEVRITDPKQAADLIRQGFDYTQKTMELAEQRRAMQTQVEQLLTNRELLRQQLAHLERLQGPAVTQTPSAPAQPQAPDPDDVPTVAQTQQLLQAQLAHAQAQTQQMIQQALLQTETARYEQEYRGEVQRTIADTLTRFPALKDIDKVEKLILDDVAEQVRNRIELEPGEVVEIADVKRMIADVAQRRHAKYEARVKEHLKMEAVRAAKAAHQSIEPPGGAPAAPAAAAEKLSLNDPRLTQLAIADLQAAFSRK